MQEMDLRKNKLDRASCIILFLAIVLITMVVSPFSPLWRFNFEPDESVYSLISRGFLHGKVPYRDLFDHKGPLTYCFYILGFLLSGERNWGVWVIFSLVNAVTFFQIYRTYRLFLNEIASTVSVTLMLLLIAYCNASIFSSASKPEHLILMFLMLSMYPFVKQTLLHMKEYKKREDKVKVFSLKDMFFFGICCGAVFMIKMNICIFYLSFIGAYFLWVLFRKRIKLLLSSGGVFAAGIAVPCLPFVLYFAANHALRDFIDTYFVFNLHYGALDQWLSFESKFQIHSDAFKVNVIFLFLLLISIIIVVLKAQEKERAQFLVLTFCGIAVIYFVFYAPLFLYSFVVLMPLYMLGLPEIGKLFAKFLEGEKVKKFVCLLLILPVILSATVGIFLKPPICREPNELESAMTAYVKVHPHATYICFPCRYAYGMFYDLSDGIPDFKYFYLPPDAPHEVFVDEAHAIQAGKPDVIIVANPQVQDPKIMQSYYDFFEENGYTYYTEGPIQYMSNDIFAVYIKKDGLE